MPNKAAPRSGSVSPRLRLDFLVVLAGTDPLVWRRIRVPATYSFWDLHLAIQDAMGWLDCHLHSFRVVDPDSATTMTLGIPDPDLDEDHAFVADWTEYVVDFLEGAPQPFQYTYDFGDDWDHAVIFEGFQEVASKSQHPICMAGAGACPPEDSGGVHGYAELLHVLQDPNHPDYDDMVEWVGDEIDPHKFLLGKVRFDNPEERWRRTFDDGTI